MRNKIKLAYQLIIRGKWTMKIITVLLSAFSFALFALASTAYTYSERGYIVKNYLYAKQQNPRLVFYDYETADKNSIQSEDIALIKETLPLDYLYNYVCEIDFSHFVGKYFTEWTAEYFHPVNNVVTGTEELFQRAEYELLEGRYPVAENEIAIDLSLYETFHWGGYSDNYDNYIGFAYDRTKESHPPVEINSYSDIIGKRIVAWEKKDPDVGGNHYGDDAKQVFIVGVYNIPNSSSEWSVRKVLTEPQVIRSEAWQKVREKNNPYVQAMFVPDVSDILDKKFVGKCLDVTEIMLTRFIERNGEREFNTYSLGAMGMSGYFNEVESLNLVLLVKIFVVAGFVLLIFSVTLMVYFITAIMNQKSKQVGLLRAFGTPKRTIVGIFVMGICVLAALIFIISLTLTASVYFRILKPWLTFGGEWPYAPMQFNGWTVLILFGVSFITPILSVIFPILKFFKSTIVDNLKGMSTKKKKRRTKCSQ